MISPQNMSAQIENTLISKVEPLKAVLETLGTGLGGNEDQSSRLVFAADIILDSIISDLNRLVQLGLGKEQAEEAEGAE
nr:hypothetical protein 4 [Desulfobacteraceae bacterium]